MNGKHSYQDKFKPYEIVSENRDPILGPNSPDAPAGFSRVQRRKWKLWINTLTGKMFTRKSKYENEWKEVEGGGSCPNTIAEYDNHYFVGRNATITPGEVIYGWDLTVFLPFMNYDVVMWFGEQNQVGVTSVQQAYNTLQSIADYFQQNWLDPNYPAGYVLSVQGNTLVLSWTGAGADPYGINTFLFGAYDVSTGQFILPNDVDGAYSFIDEISTPGTETLGECEVVKVNEGIFDCAVDEVFFTKPSQTIILDGKYQGWSYPEGVQWSNVPQRDNRSWTVFFNNLDTDGIGGVPTTPVTQAFTSFNELSTELNNQLIAYGSSYRVVAVGNDRLLVADNNYNPLLAGDPYFSTHAFNQFMLVIEDSVTNSDWLIKGRNPKSLGLTNVTHQVGLGGIYKGTIGCGGISSLPVPKIMIDKELKANIMDKLNLNSFLLKGLPVVHTSDLSAEQLAQGVRLEFVYYRTGKSKSGGNPSAWKSGYVHPAHTNFDGTAVYNDGSRGGNHYVDGVPVPMVRPSEFNVTSNNQLIEVRAALHSRMTQTNIWYRDFGGNNASVEAFIPNRRVHKLGKSSKFAYSGQLAPLYFAFRYAIRKADGTWESGPLSQTLALTCETFPFIVDTTIQPHQASVHPAYRHPVFRCYFVRDRVVPHIGR